MAKRIFGAQYAQELLLAARGSSKRNKEWVRRLQDVVTALNNEETQMIGMKPVDAIKLKDAAQPQNKIVLKRPIDATIRVRYLLYSVYAPGELEGGERRRATDSIWSLNVYDIDRVVRTEGWPALCHLKPTISGSDAPKRNFVREELLVVPENTEMPQTDYG